MLTQAVIFLPSVGRYHHSLLEEHIETAQIAILPFTEPGGSQLSAGLRQELLLRAGVTAVVFCLLFNPAPAGPAQPAAAPAVVEEAK